MKILSKNKYAYLNYDIQEVYEAWIVLNWFEVKAIKTWNINIKESFVKIYSDWKIYITNMNVPLYKKTSYKIVPWYDSKRKRQLLLHKKQIQKLAERTNKTWLVLIPLKIYENRKSLIKIEIWLWKLRKKVEKKQILKERDIKRQAERDIKKLNI